MRFRLLALTILLCFPQLANAQGEWVEVPGPITSRPFSGIASSERGHLVVLGYRFVSESDVRNSVFWSTDEGMTWQEGFEIRNEPLDFLSRERHVDFHFFNPRVGVQTSGRTRSHLEYGDEIQGKLRITDDSGRTWQVIEDEIGWPCFFQLNESSIVHLPFFGPIFNPVLGQDIPDSSGYISILEGSVQKRVNYKLSPELMQASSIDGQSIKVVAGTILFSSSDGGASFARDSLVRSDVDSMIQLYTIEKLRDGIYLGGASYGVFRSSADGISWSRVADMRYPRFVRSGDEVMAYTNPNFPSMGTLRDSFVLESTDGGRNWVKHSSDAPIIGVSRPSSGLTYLLAGNKIYKRERPANVSSPEAKASALILNNPVSDQLTLRAAAENITITDITGRNILRAMATDRVDVSMLPSGVYQLVVTSREGTRSQMFVIER